MHDFGRPKIEVSTDLSCEQIIANKTVKVLQGFLLELALGNTKYKSLHNLTEQVEHQYYGRFLVELIQNAHDALIPKDKEAISRRIEIRIQEDDGPHGALYVANDGLPFSYSNFDSLSELGQSDKDPKESIGNKGIGFRSVLQITDSPEIYSRGKTDSEVFDGYCFRFFPGIIKKFELPILELLEGKQDTLCPYSQKEKLLPGGNELYSKLLENCSQKEKIWLREELSYLSPYLFPERIRVENRVVRDFERNGFATLIRLPFLDEEAYRSALKKLEELPDDMVLFLDRVESLRLVIGNSIRTLERVEENLKNDPELGKEILLSIKNEEGSLVNEHLRGYWLWQETYGGEDEPEEKERVKEAVAGLPGKWPDLRKAKASFAVRVDDEPEQGCLNIYLPTKMTSGCHAHFSAPFYGDMNRTVVEFNNENEYNHLLMSLIAFKSVKVVKNTLAGKNITEAAAIIDLLSPNDTEIGSYWRECLVQAEETLEINLREEHISLSNIGWKSLDETRVLPDVEKQVMITEALLRGNARTPILVEKLSSRKQLFIQLYKYLDIDYQIDEMDLVDTVEAIAEKLHKEGEVDWNIFWKDVERLFPNSKGCNSWYLKMLFDKNI